MTDLERRLTESLESAAEVAPDPTGLVVRARERARRRARTRAVGGVVAVVLAVAAVPVALALADGDGSQDPTVVDTPSPTPDADWRTETYHDLEVRVPPSWDYGALSVPCLRDGRPAVERPGGVVPAIGCGGASHGYGVRFVDTALLDAAGPPGELRRSIYPPGELAGPQSYPDRAWVGYRTDGSGRLAVQVVASDRTLAEQVLGSVRIVEGTDGNGCAVRMEGDAPAIAEGTVAICRYDRGDSLEQSELLSGEDAAAASSAVEAAPPASGSPTRCSDEPRDFVNQVVFREAARDVVVVMGSGCDLNGVLIGAERRQLTKDVVYWALSPGFAGALSRGTPLPERFRR